jgi:lipopolysaccharide transport system permease protein
MSSVAPSRPGFVSHLNPIGLGASFFALRGVIWQFAVRNFHARHKGSYLGIAWSVLNPLLLLGLYYIVFTKIFPTRFTGTGSTRQSEVALALLIGMSVFHFLSEVIAQSPALIVGSPNLVKKVVFPVEVLPVANLGACLVNFAFSMGWVLLGMVCFGQGIPASAAWLPVIVGPMLLLGAGLSWLLAGLGVFFRDIAQLTQLLNLLLMYISAVFYPGAAVRAHPAVWAVLRFNPVIHIIDSLRGVLLWHQPLDGGHLLWLYLGCGVICLFGYAVFASLRQSFADVL